MLDEVLFDLTFTRSKKRTSMEGFCLIFGGSSPGLDPNWSLLASKPRYWQCWRDAGDVVRLGSRSAPKRGPIESHTRRGPGSEGQKPLREC